MALEEADDADRKVYAELMGEEIERFQSLQKRKKLLICGLNRKHTKIIAYWQLTSIINKTARSVGSLLLETTTRERVSGK